MWTHERNKILHISSTDHSTSVARPSSFVDGEYVLCCSCVRWVLLRRKNTKQFRPFNFAACSQPLTIHRWMCMTTFSISSATGILLLVLLNRQTRTPTVGVCIWQGREAISPKKKQKLKKTHRMIAFCWVPLQQHPAVRVHSNCNKYRFFSRTHHPKNRSLHGETTVRI